MSRMDRGRRSGRRSTTGYRSSIPAVRRAPVQGMRRRRKSGPMAFIKRNYKLIAIASFVVVVAVLCVVLFVFGKEQPVTADQLADQPTATETQDAVPTTEVAEFNEDQEYSYEGVDESILAGMAGTDESLFSEDGQALENALLAEEGIRVGITIGDMVSDMDTRMLSDLEKASSTAESEKLIYKAYYYNAGGSYDQQLQDVRSLIKNKVDIIIVGATSAQNFEMVTFMAEEAGIPVVACDAPVDTGYMINVVADQDAWAGVYGDFMAQNLTEGTVATVLGSGEDAADTARQSAISKALPGSETLTVLDTAYGQWQHDGAEEAMAALLDANRSIDGIITEEGMAQGVIDACIKAGRLPGVMCGDASAGFIKTWYKLVRNGVDISDEDAEEPVMLAVEPEDFVVCAQPAPTSISAAAFEIALKLAQGRTLAAGEGTTYEYTVQTLITNDNIREYFELVKDEKDSYWISDTVPDETIESIYCFLTLKKMHSSLSLI